MFHNVQEMCIRDRYMDVKPNAKRPSVAYFCMEYGINQVVKILSLIHI